MRAIYFRSYVIKTRTSPRNPRCNGLAKSSSDDKVLSEGGANSQHHYEEGQFVWYLSETRKEGICPKLQPTYLGPLVITRKFNGLIFNIF